MFKMDNKQYANKEKTPVSETWLYWDLKIICMFAMLLSVAVLIVIYVGFSGLVYVVLLSSRYSNMLPNVNSVSVSHFL